MQTTSSVRVSITTVTSLILDVAALRFSWWTETDSLALQRACAVRQRSWSDAYSGQLLYISQILRAAWVSAHISPFHNSIAFALDCYMLHGICYISVWFQESP